MLNLEIRPANPRPDLISLTQALSRSADWVGLRYYRETTQSRAFRNGKSDTNSVEQEQGIMVEALVDGQLGYSGTTDLSLDGLSRALEQAKLMARAAAPFAVASFDPSLRPASKGYYRSPVFQALSGMSVSDLNGLLAEASRTLKASEEILTATATARLVETEIDYVSSSGAEIRQQFLFLTTHYSATAQNGSEQQTRSDKGYPSRSMQAGLELLDRQEILERCKHISAEAIQLLSAPNCPSDTRDLILRPEQMLIQIHESIGHPLEIDRILGDERNFAGWSFVKLEDFGKLQYGSKLMNITFDPSMPGEFASYAFDDAGTPAEKQFLIKDGVLLRGLGGLESQRRANVPGVANFRSSSWNRAPIDRMANINLEPGDSSLQKMIEQTERGIIMHANTSWSIDDYRNKFQFGCEFAELVEDGRVTCVVKNPNYRGMTVPFWNQLKAVGNAEELELYGTPFCGKGEPSQIIRVGHAAPPCLFSQVEVFGGAE